MHKATIFMRSEYGPRYWHCEGKDGRESPWDFSLLMRGNDNWSYAEGIWVPTTESLFYTDRVNSVDEKMVLNVFGHNYRRCM